MPATTAPTTPPARRALRMRALRHVLLCIGLVAPGWADAWTLDALMRLPLERLMELQVTPQRGADDRGACPRQAPCAAKNGGRHAA